MLFRAPPIARVLGGLGAVACAAVAVYAVGSALDWWGARLCVADCAANDTDWFPLIVGGLMIVGSALLAVWTWQLSTHRTSLSPHGVASSNGGATDEFLEWSEIERFELVGRPGFPAQVHAVAEDGTTMRLRGLAVSDGEGRGRPVDEFRDAVALAMPRSIPIVRRS